MKDILILCICYGLAGILFVILLIYLSKSQSKHASSLKVGDVVNYNGFPAKIKEISGNKAKIETTMNLISSGKKVDVKDYKFENKT